jgi:hypothetical protein
MLVSGIFDMKTELEADAEGYLYIFSRMLKSEGHEIEHSRGCVKVHMEDETFQIKKESSVFRVEGQTEKFIEHMESVFRAEGGEDTVEKLENLGFRLNN